MHNLINLRGVMSNEYKSGCSARFWEMGNVGVKLLYDKESCEYVYKMQKLLSLHGLAPKCWGRFNTVYTKKWGKTYHAYGFITEKIQVNKIYGTIFQHPDGPALVKKAMDLGIALADLYTNNFGTNKNGNLQILDTGHSTYSGRCERMHFEFDEIHEQWTRSMKCCLEN